MIVDAHHHVWDLEVRPQAWLAGDGLSTINRSFPPAEYDGLARAAGIDASVLVETVNIGPETRELCAQAAESEVIAAVVGWTDLTAESVADDVADLVEGPHGSWLRGVRHQVQVEPDPRWLARDVVRRGIAAVGAAGLVYEFVVLPDQWPAVLETARALPEVTFVLDHAGKPPLASGDLAAWHSWVRELSAVGNVTCKLSGLVTEADWHTWRPAHLAPVAEALLTTFGPGRLMLGSDWPVCLLAGGFERVLDAYRALLDSCSDAERAAVLGGTACDVYRIPLP
jgi:L-fuconolactonase